MGCGKSKHAVETATTVIKSTNSDGTKLTTTTTATATKTVKETTTGSSLIQKDTLHVEDVNETTATDPSGGVAKTDNVAPVLGENTQPARVLENDVKVDDSNPTDNVAPTSAEVVRGDEKVNVTSPADISTVVSTSSKDNVGTVEAVIEDEGKGEFALKADTNTKTDNVVPAEEDKTKESNLTTTDNKTKNEFLTPTLSEDVVGPFDVAKGGDGPKDNNLKVKEQELVVKTAESTTVEAKKDQEAVEVTETDIVKAKFSVPTETERVPIASEPKVAETQEKKP